MGGVEGAGSPIMLNIRRLKGETKSYSNLHHHFQNRAYHPHYHNHYTDQCHHPYPFDICVFG